MKAFLQVLAVIVPIAMAVAVGWRMSWSDGSRADAEQTALASQPLRRTIQSSANSQPSERSTTASSSPVPIADQHPESLTKQRCLDVLNQKDTAERLVAFEKLVSSITDRAGLETIIQVFQVMSDSGRKFEREWEALWRIAARRDPPGTMALIQKHGEGQKWLGNVMVIAMKEWGWKDPQAAIQWRAAHEQSVTGSTHDAAMRGLVTGYAELNLQTATTYALKAVSGEDQDMNAQITRVLAARAQQQGGTMGLFSWFNALPDDEQKGRLFDAVANQLGETSFSAKRDWLESKATESYRDDRTYRGLVNEIAKRDARAGMEYAVNLPRSPKDGGCPGIGAASFEWLVQNETEFTTWFSSQPQGEVHDNILKAIQNSLDNDKLLPANKREPALRFMKTVGR